MFCRRPLLTPNVLAEGANRRQETPPTKEVAGFEAQAESELSGDFLEILELLVDYGFEGMAQAMQMLLNEAMKLERSQKPAPICGRCSTHPVAAKRKRCWA
jgi:hypothetical protein